MKKVDYIIVGLGIAGLTFCEQLIANSKTFVVYTGSQKPATAVSGGVLNPTVLKRFTLAWRGNEFFNYSTDFYKRLEVKLGINIINETPIYRIIKSVEEQNDWAVASDKNKLGIFLDPKILPNQNPAIKTSFGLGEVKHTAIVDTELILKSYREMLQNNMHLIENDFDYNNLIENENGSFSNNEFIADKIIFAEGSSAFKNPFLPKNIIIGNKGEYIIVKASNLNMDAMLKGPMFIIPLGNSHYKVGATYKRDDYTLTISEEAKLEIASKLSQMINCSFEIVDQVAGIRPTIKDRKPIIGNLEDNNNMYFFNGLGTRGLTMAPLLAEQLFNFAEQNIALDADLNIRRFL